MDPEGPNLRRLYLPGLDALKSELAAFELLLSWRLPELHAHLQAFGLPPVLYVAQWLMTLFATPFPPAFSARAIDVLLQVRAWCVVGCSVGWGGVGRVRGAAWREEVWAQGVGSCVGRRARRVLR